MRTGIREALGSPCGCRREEDRSFWLNIPTTYFVSEKCMSKQKKPIGKEQSAVETKAASPEPQPTRRGYIIPMAVVGIGLVIQMVVAVMVYGGLPPQIHGSWLGLPDPYQMLPSWVVFVAFPCADLILLVLGYLSAKDSEGKRVMESGKAATLVLLALLFTVLQVSAFRLIQR